MRNVGLDCLRFIAVMLVLGRHMVLPEGASNLLKLWQRGGWIGVDLFFVLSGFLVSSLLFKEVLRTGQADVKRFLIRRAYKIYPAFWIFLAFTFALTFVRGDQVTLAAFLGEMLFLQNYLGGIWQHTWSLAVEEHFYLGMAFLFWVIRRRQNANPLLGSMSFIPKTFAIVAIGCLLFRVMNLWICPEYDHRYYLFGTHIRIDSLTYGVLLSYLWHFRNLEQRIARIPTWLLVLSGCSLLAPAFMWELADQPWISIVGVIGLYIGSGNILLAALRYRETNLDSVKLCSSLGAASYSIYLWHMPVNYWGYTAIQSATGLGGFEFYLVVYLLGSFGFGWLMNRVIEAPVLQLRDQRFPSALPRAA